MPTPILSLLSLLMVPVSPNPIAVADAPPAHVAVLRPVLRAPMPGSSARGTFAAMLWDAHGHRTIAALAYARLRPATRARVEALLRRHPDIDSLAAGTEPASSAGMREVLMRASVWPDRIRNDPRFHDAGTAATPLLPGYPDMLRRSDWHYVTRAFSDDGTRPVPMPPPGTPAQLADAVRMLADTSRAMAERAYWLSWIVHVVGDLHQPLHGTSRASYAQPDGDAGGNRFWVRRSSAATDSVRLHAVWDGAFTATDGPRDAPAAADRVARVHPFTPSMLAPRAVLDGAAALLQSWADESATLAQHVAYAVGPRDDGAPPVMDSAYVALRGRVATTRIAQAADRLVVLLEAALGETHAAADAS